MTVAKRRSFWMGLLFAAGCGSRVVTVVAPSPPAFSPVTHGVAAGDVTDTRAVIWAQTDAYAAMHVRIDAPSPKGPFVTWVSEAHDFAGKVVLDGLSPNTTYRYTVWFASDERLDAPLPAAAAHGVFRTAPRRDVAKPVTFAWSGDLGGLNVCRDATEGYPIFERLGGGLDFFIGLGDMIYADQPCNAVGLYKNAQIPAPVAEASTLRAYWAHWKYNRDDPGLRRLLASTDYVAVWDDHEVVNDFGPRDDWHSFPPYVIGASLLPLGRQALLDENPIPEDRARENRLYRSLRWGKNLELVILDTRSYRDRNDQPDTAPTPKTMLGAEQKQWFESTVEGSDATWKFVVSSVPISIPTGRGGKAGHDGWANFDSNVGFERELAEIWSSFRDAGVTNLVWITTDVHFATGFVYHPFPESPSFTVYEFTAGPLNAMLLPTESVDDTFHPERLFFYGPKGDIPSFAEAKRWMNFGRAAIDAGGGLTVTIVNALGEEVAQRSLAPAND